MERLEQFETMLEEVKANYAQAEERVCALKAQGKSKSSAMQQALAVKLTYKNILALYERHGLL